MLEVGVWGKSGVNLQPMSLKVGEGWGLGAGDRKDTDIQLTLPVSR